MSVIRCQHLLPTPVRLVDSLFDSAEPFGCELFARELKVERLRVERLVAGCGSVVDRSRLQRDSLFNNIVSQDKLVRDLLLKRAFWEFHMPRATINGQRTNPMQGVDILMQQAVSEKVFPGGVLLVSKGGTVAFHKAYGMADLVSRRRMRTETLLDLASLTKPLATALAIMMLIKQQKLDLEQHLDAVLPAFVGDNKASIKVKHLLYHNSGLPAYRAYFKDVAHVPAQKRKNELRRLLVNEPLTHPIGEIVVYSDLGFMILEWMIEYVSGLRLDQFVSEKVYGPLGIANLFFVDLCAPPTKNDFAATERCPWRNKLLVGEVHDENAYAAGGIEGHAGLFGTATAVHSLLVALLAAYNHETFNTFFPTDLVRLFFRRLPNSDKALGFDAPAGKNSSSGNFFSPNSVGHLGFTGTSFWLDLDRSVIVVLLTNRVHPYRDNDAIKHFRPKLHDAVMKQLLGII